MSSPLRIVFWGTPEFALPSLEACHRAGNLLAVVSQPDKPRGRNQKVSPCPTKAWALERSIPTFSPVSIRKDLCADFQPLQDFLRSTPVDLFMVTAYGKIMPATLLDSPKLGSVNVHASLLPRWRGAAPIQRCLEAGDLETGVCLQKMVEELDAGNVLGEKKCEIRPSEGASALSLKLSEMGGSLVFEFLEDLKERQNLVGHAQDPSKVTYANKIEKAEGLYRRSWSSDELVNKVRAFEVWPQVRSCVFQGSSQLENPPFVIILEARREESSKSLVRAGEGRISFLDKKCLLECSDGFVELLKIKVPGKGPTDAFFYFKNLTAQAGHSPLRLDNL